MSKFTVVTNKPILVAVGLFVPGYSFTRVLNSLFEPLSGYFDIHWLGLAYKGAVTKHEYYTLYPSNLKGGDIYGAYGAADMALELKAEVLFLINDVYMLKNYQRVWHPLRDQGIKLVAYTPLDGTIIDIEIMKDVIFLDSMVLYHDGAKKDVRKAMDAFDLTYPDVPHHWPLLHTIFHGVDLSAFSDATITEKKILRKKLFPVPDAENTVFILNANRHNERKNLEATIQAFGIALPYFTSPCYLILHTPNMDERKSVEIKNLITESGCADFILLNPIGDNYCDDTQLKELYQACAIGVNTAYGEGWGLISFEHAACGGAQIAPDHSCPAEIWKEVAMITPADTELVLVSNPFMMYAVDTTVLSHQMTTLVNDVNKRDEVASACIAHAAKEVFRWDMIAERWKEIM